MEFPSRLNCEWVETNGNGRLVKVFVDGVEIPEAEESDRDSGWVISADLDKYGQIYIIPNRDIVARKLTQGEVRYEWAGEKP